MNHTLKRMQKRSQMIQIDSKLFFGLVIPHPFQVPVNVVDCDQQNQNHSEPIFFSTSSIVKPSINGK